MTKRACWVLAALVLAAACSDDDVTPDTGTTPDAGVDAAADQAAPDTAAPDAAGPSAVGQACTATSTTQGTCPKGYLCGATLPGGYCTKFCLFASCPADATCVMSPKLGELCAKTCNSDADCRKSEGYTCDKEWKVCFTSSIPLSPKLKQCSASAPPRKTFGASTQLSTPAGPGKYHMEAVARRTGSGDLVTVYMAPQSSLEEVALGASTLGASGTVSGDRTLTGLRKHLYDPWLAADRKGTLYLVYYGHTGMDVDGVVGFTSSTDGTTWTTHKAVNDQGGCPGTPTPTGCFDKTMIAVGPTVGDPTKDSVYVFYAAASSLRVVRSDDGGKTFSTSTIVAAGLVYGDAEVASDGSVHVVAVHATDTGLGSTGNRVEYTRSTDGGKTFSAVETVSAAGASIPFYFSNPQVAPLPTPGTVHVVYPHGKPDGAWDLELASSKDWGKTWTRVKVNDDTHCANHMIPTIAAEPTSGKLHVAWFENRDGTGRVAYAACDAGGAKCGANEAVSDKPFAAYELVRHSPKWPGEYFELLVDEQGKTIEAVWSQTVSESGKAVGRIFHAKGSL